MKKILLTILGTATLLQAYDLTVSEPLSLEKAIVLLKENNLELKNSHYDLEIAQKETQASSGLHYGKLEFVQDFARSNDAGNVFGFKLASREANFGDFGFSEFLEPLGGAIYNASQGIAPQDMSTLLSQEPQDLNYPGYRNFFQSKLKYEVPLFTGFAISSYNDIMHSMQKMKSLDKEKLLNEQVYQLRKSFYDMALLNESSKNLTKIFTNIETLENITQEMINVGYAKKIDLLEVQARKGNVQRVLLQMESNKELLYHYISFLLNTKVKQIITPSFDVEVPKITMQEILQNNIDIQRALTGLEIYSSMLDASKASLYPTLGAFAEVATADNNFMQDANDHKAYTLGARLSWNIFNGGIDSAKIEKSKIEQLKTKTQVELAKKGIALQVDKIQTEIKTFNAEITSLQKELLLADEIYKNYEGRYKEQLSSMSDVIVKQSEQIEKILELQMVKNKRNEKIFALEKIANGAF